MSKSKDNMCPCCELENEIYDVGVCISCFDDMCDKKLQDNYKINRKDIKDLHTITSLSDKNIGLLLDIVHENTKDISSLQGTVSKLIDDIINASQMMTNLNFKLEKHIEGEYYGHNEKHESI